MVEGLYAAAGAVQDGTVLAWAGEEAPVVLAPAVLTAMRKAGVAPPDWVRWLG